MFPQSQVRKGVGGGGWRGLVRICKVQLSIKFTSNEQNYVLLSLMSCGVPLQFYIFFEKPSHLLKTFSPTYDAIILLWLSVKGLKIDHCFLTYRWGLPNSPLPALSRKQLGNTQHVHPAPKILQCKWSWVFTFLLPPLCIPVKFYHIQRRWGFSSFFLPLNPN